MLEVCFSDSVKGALALAQHCGKDTVGGAVSFITDRKGPAAWLAKWNALREYKKRQKELAKIAVPLGGKREDIAGLSFGFSEGDIQAPILSGECPRKEYIRQWLAFDPYCELGEREEPTQAFWSACLADLEKVQAAPSQLRVWADHTPNARCGLLFLASLLEGKETEVHLVELPRAVTREDGCVVEYRSWGEVEPQRFGTFLDRERVMTREELSALARQWQQLQEENAPLRVVEGDRVVSAPLSYYDPLIRKEFPAQSCEVARIIGLSLGRQKIPTGDVFIARRIQHFIHQGELVVLEETGRGFYSTRVACAPK